MYFRTRLFLIQFLLIKRFLLTYEERYDRTVLNLEVKDNSASLHMLANIVKSNISYKFASLTKRMWAPFYSCCAP